MGRHQQRIVFGKTSSFVHKFPWLTFNLAGLLIILVTTAISITFYPDHLHGVLVYPMVVTQLISNGIHILYFGALRKNKADFKEHLIAIGIGGTLLITWAILLLLSPLFQS